jgi:hypothetical protein
MWCADPGNFLGIRSENAAWANENTPVEEFSMSGFLMTGRCPYDRFTTMKVGGFGPFRRSVNCYAAQRYASTGEATIYKVGESGAIQGGSRGLQQICFSVSSHTM